MIIGFTGKAGSGKDTLADHLVNDFSFRKMSFAHTLKAMMVVAGFAEPYDRAEKEQLIPGFNFTWREAAQRLGTEWGRALDPDIWVKIQERVLAALPAGTNVVFSDVRFDNEAAMIRRLGGKILHVTGRAADLGENAGHASEAGVMWADGDVVITNDGTLEESFTLVRLATLGEA